MNTKNSICRIEKAMAVDLGKYNNSEYSPGANLFVRILWYWVNAVVFNSWLVPVSSIKQVLLVAFGAELGRGVVIKPRVNIKYPWYLSIGNNVWLGEGVWIDNLAPVIIGDNVCISQNAYLLTGNHDYKDPAFSLIVSEIKIESGAWIGAQSIVCPGSCVAGHAILSVGSVLIGDAEPYGIYKGNPARMVRKRVVGKLPNE